jgi:phenylalanine-4-hydroxylase
MPRATWPESATERRFVRALNGRLGHHTSVVRLQTRRANEDGRDDMEASTELPARPEPKNRFWNARRNADFIIEQDWAAYSPAEHDRWDRLFRRSVATLQGRACDEFLAMVKALELSDGGIPDMRCLSDRLQKITGWTVVPVAELVPDDVFFNHLANRRFPAGAFIRPEEEMEYLKEPDVFHDIFGHVPLLADQVYADFLVAYGKGGQRAMQLGQLANLARLYWYTVEFGLIRSSSGLRIFGAGILSSVSESVFALESASPNRIGFDLLRVMRTKYEIDNFQQTYFVIESFEASGNARISPTPIVTAISHNAPRRKPTAIPQSLIWPKRGALPRRPNLLTSRRLEPFWGLQHPVVARPDASVVDDPSRSGDPVPKQFANSCSPTRHVMLKSKMVYGLQLFGGQHDLQTLFPHQAVSAVPVPVPHDEASIRQGHQDHLTSYLLICCERRKRR